MSKENDELNFLLNQRGIYLGQLQSVSSETNNFLSPSVSDDSESSDEECASTKVLIKTEPTENDTDDINIPIKDEYQAEEHVEINIKHEIIDERVDFQEANDNDTGLEYDEHVGNEEVDANDTKNTVNEENETENYDKVKNNEDDQTELKTDLEVNPLINIKEEESSSSGKFTFKRQCRKPKNDSLENEQTSKIESRKPINIKEEPVDYADEEIEGLDHSEDIIDGVRRELRPRKLNEPHIYFEPYDGSTSEGSDFTDESD